MGLGPQTLSERLLPPRPPQRAMVPDWVGDGLGLGRGRRQTERGAKGPLGVPQIGGTDDGEAETLKKRGGTGQEVREIPFCIIIHLQAGQ